MNRSRLITFASCATAAVSLALGAGCRDQSAGAPRGPATRANAQGGLFESVADNLDHLEQFEIDQILKQVCDRLNQWNMQERPEVDWRPDPLIADLAEPLRQGVEVRSIDQVRFQDPADGWYLQEGVWLRDISALARADRFEDLAVAERLFDWTVRNIQLEPDDAAERHHLPYETLLLGRGTAIERAWVFILLARQQGLDVVMLGLADEKGDAVRPWLPALALDDQLYLFDTRLGLPIPGPEADSIATLADVVADESLQRQLDLDDEHPYPVKADDLKHVVAYVEGSPTSLSKRMALVESRLRGKQRMKLTSPGHLLAERVAKLPHVAEARLWPMPFEVAQARASRSPEEAQRPQRELVLFHALPLIRKARALQFKGEYEGPEGAKTLLLRARPPSNVIEDYKLPDEMAKQVPRASIPRIEAAQILMMREGKQGASYWLGLIFLDQEDYPNAIDFLETRTLEASGNNPWSASARYNLARAYEAQGQLDKAIELYGADTDSPQSHGNRLRARRLAERQEASAAEPAAE